MANAHAKVILFGEHAVVHGRLAVAVALDRGARAESEPAEISEVEVATWERSAKVGDDDDLARAYAAILGALELDRPMRTRVEVDVPGGVGLGCSAAIGVAIARALAGSGASLERIEGAATAWERVFHGTPSGIDVAAAARGGAISFRKSEGARTISFPEPIELAVTPTGETSSTKAMVDAVARQLARRPLVVERTFDGIDTLAKKGASAIEAARWYEVGQLMNLNQALLASLMLSTEKIEEACGLARGAEALGAKLTGAGGGGCVVALAPGRVDAVLEAWKKAGLTGFAATIAATRVIA